MKKGNFSSVKSAILTFAIAIVLVFFLAYAVSAVYPLPGYGDFCKERKNPKAIENRTGCESVGGKWIDFGVPRVEGGNGGYCDADYGCRKDYSQAKEEYEKNLFFVNISLGILAILISVYLRVGEASGGFMLGGVIMLIYGGLRNWGRLSDIWRTLMLGVALAFLIGFAYKKFGKDSKS